MGSFVLLKFNERKCGPLFGQHVCEIGYVAFTIKKVSDERSPEQWWLRFYDNLGVYHDIKKFPRLYDAKHYATKLVAVDGMKAALAPFGVKDDR